MSSLKTLVVGRMYRGYGFDESAGFRGNMNISVLNAGKGPCVYTEKLL